MTLEEKAKEFDASLERAKKLRETCDSTAVIGWCEYIFPMLKEPKAEDEKQCEQNYEFHGIVKSRPAKGKLKELCQELSQSKMTKKSDQDGMATDIAIKALNHNNVNDSYCKENCKGYQETGYGKIYTALEELRKFIVKLQLSLKKK